MYVALTGAKANAGDFLIRHRAYDLFRLLRPDREIHDVPRWQPLDDETLELVNGSRALILCGGPAYQKDLYPGIYPLTASLDRIEVPIIAFGLGWKGMPGRAGEVATYRLSPSSLELLDRIEHSGHDSSCRDYLTLDMLAAKGVRRQIMTGCPAWYVESRFRQPLQVGALERLAFSTGATMLYSRRMWELTAELIRRLHRRFGDKLVVSFHYPLSVEDFQGRYTKRWAMASTRAQRELIEILDHAGIEYVDLSKTAEKLVEFYDTVDLHVGFRLHAHLDMCANRRPSILLVEDGRGLGAWNALGGCGVEAIERVDQGRRSKAMRRVGLGDTVQPFGDVAARTMATIEYELEHGFPRCSQVCDAIDRHFAQMKRFMKQLP